MTSNRSINLNRNSEMRLFCVLLALSFLAISACYGEGPDQDVSEKVGAVSQTISTACSDPTTATITGTAGDDYLLGTPGDDVIFGLGGNDIILGKGGNDILCGGPGNDSIQGGDGNDEIDGGPGYNWLHGHNGDDTIYGGDDGNELQGNDGDDTLMGGAGLDTIYGGHGDDIAKGGAGDDDILGNDGNDRLFGDAGDDWLVGGEGNDCIDGGSDDDQLLGQGGDDCLDGGGGVDQVACGGGNDTHTNGEWDYGGCETSGACGCGINPEFALQPPIPDLVELLLFDDTTTQDNAVMMAQISDPRVGTELIAVLDNETIILHDDGLGVDVTAGDGVYVGIVSIDLAQVEADLDVYNNRLTAQGFPLQNSYDGRAIKGTSPSGPLHVTMAPDPSPQDPLAYLGITLPVNVPTAPPCLVALPSLNPLMLVGTTDRFKTLLIRDPAVLSDPARTWDPCDPTAGTPGGVWTFGHLMREMANTPQSGVPVEDFVREWLEEWRTDEVAPVATHNDGLPSGTTTIDSIPDREIGICEIVKNFWPSLSTGMPLGPSASCDAAFNDIDVDRAPFRLLAIVNRVDLRQSVGYGGGSAGEGRFVFGLADGTSGGCSPFGMTVIFEYGVPIRGCSNVRSYARDWYNLDSFTSGSAPFNAALEAITTQFTERDLAPAKPNGSAINQVRTSEVAFAFFSGGVSVESGLGQWELREFTIDPATGLLGHDSVNRTPNNLLFDPTLTGSPGTNDPVVTSWINANAGAIIAERHTLPATFMGTDLLGSHASFLPGTFWGGAGVTNPDARHKFSLNTCNACHSGETPTVGLFYHVSPFVGPGTEAPISGFLDGPTNMIDPFDGVTNRVFDDLQRRNDDLETLVTRQCLVHLVSPVLLLTH